MTFIKTSNLPKQCIIVRQWTTRHLIAHYSAHSCALFAYFLVAIYIFSYCALFMLPSLHTAPFPCCTFSCTNLFILLFTRCNVFALHPSLVALFACCNFFLLRFVHVAPFPEMQPGTSKMNSFTAIINKIVKYYCKVLLLRCLQGSSLRLCYLQVALFSCCICFMLKFFNIEKY